MMNFGTDLQQGIGASTPDTADGKGRKIRNRRIGPRIRYRPQSMENAAHNLFNGISYTKAILSRKLAGDPNSALVCNFPCACRVSGVPGMDRIDPRYISALPPLLADCIERLTGSDRYRKILSRRKEYLMR